MNRNAEHDIRRKTRVRRIEAIGKRKPYVPKARGLQRHALPVAETIGYWRREGTRQFEALSREPNS